jgi:hypothetical protein
VPRKRIVNVSPLILLAKIGRIELQRYTTQAARW